MQCAELLRTQAYFDGEADALTAATIEAHVAHCTACQVHLEGLRQLRDAVRQEAPFAHVPNSVRTRLLASLDRESEGPSARRRNAFWTGAFAGIATTAAAAGLAFFLLLPLYNPLPDELVAAHVRSLMPSHLIDVVSTDRHTVKPWFAGNADVSPVVADFDGQGFRLVGGRADYFDHQRAAVIVYRHGPHVLNVFSWAAGRHSLPKNTTRGGYHLAFWQSGDLAYCAVSDAGWDELLTLTRLLQALSNQAASNGDDRQP